MGSVDGSIAVVSSLDLSKIMFLPVHDFCVSDIAFCTEKISSGKYSDKVAVVSCGLDKFVICTPLKANVTSSKQLMLLVTIFMLLLAILFKKLRRVVWCV